MAIVAVRKAIFAHFGNRDHFPALIPAPASGSERGDAVLARVTSRPRIGGRSETSIPEPRLVIPKTRSFLLMSHLRQQERERERERVIFTPRGRLCNNARTIFRTTNRSHVDANGDSNVNLYRANYAPIIIHARAISQWHTVRRVVRAAD